MDGFEATKVVLQRIQTLDPENASKIMGFLLIHQEHSEKEMIRLAFGSDALLHSVILKAKTELLSLRPNSGAGAAVHRRSSSVSDVSLGSGDPILKPCVYFARGFCKNGASCRFIHGSGDEEQCHQLLRSKSALQQSDKFVNFLIQQQAHSPRAAAAALMMSNTMHKLSRACLSNPSSRQIYLTFPADSTFKEEDVSNYFSNFGPVQDVRIPYQQKRMFGFVTFVFPETVKIILAKGNPHFVCESRVLVKPYKEKGKVPEKYRNQQEQIERGEFSPTGVDSADPFDLPLGMRMFFNNAQDMLWRRKLEEEADLQQAIELQSRRLMSLRLLDAKRSSHHHRTQSMGAVIQSPTQNHVFWPDCSSPKPIEDNIADENTIVSDKDERSSMIENGNGKETQDNRLPESLEHTLPDSPFASPKAEADKNEVAFPEPSNNNLVSSALYPVSASPDITSFNSCYLQMSQSPTGQGTIGM